MKGGWLQQWKLGALLLDEMVGLWPMIQLWWLQTRGGWSTPVHLTLYVSHHQMQPPVLFLNLLQSVYHIWTWIRLWHTYVCGCCSSNVGGRGLCPVSRILRVWWSALGEGCRLGKSLSGPAPASLLSSSIRVHRVAYGIGQSIAFIVIHPSWWARLPTWTHIFTWGNMSHFHSVITFIRLEGPYVMEAQSYVL